MFKVFVDYPSYDEEYDIAERTTGAELPMLSDVLQRDEILRLQALVRRVPAAPSVIHYALELARLTRPGRDGGGSAAAAERPSGSSARRGVSELVDRLVNFGAGPRAVQFLLLGGKARAVMRGRKHVAIEDIQAMAYPVLRHRILTNYAAEAEGYDPDRIIRAILEAYPGPETDESRDGRVRKILES